VEYLIGLLKKAEPDWEELFKRFERFYLEWCDGKFIDDAADTLPQRKARQLQQYQVDVGQRQVDIFTGLNVLILLQETHRYAQSVEALKTAIHFYPCGQPDSGGHDDQRLLRMIQYSDCLQLRTFNKCVGKFLSGASLGGASLSSADLSGANLRGANLSEAYLFSANLFATDLRHADLSRADLSSAVLSVTKLSCANLSEAKLLSANIRYANLNGANLRSALLSRADLTNARLRSSNLSRTNLSRAFLMNADLSGANLSRANLRSADLIWAKVRGALIRSADLSGANLSSANLHEILWDGETHWAGAQGLHTALNVPESLAQTARFKAAVVLSQGIDECKRGNVLAAMQAYQNAQLIDTGLEIDANIWDLLCWVGALHNQAAEILYASEKATHARPGSPNYRDTRGLVRALTGDLQGAIEDFQSVLDQLGDNKRYTNSYRSVGFEDAQQRRAWLKALRLGENPFTPEVLEALRKQTGIGYDGESEEAEDENGQPEWDLGPEGIRE
jgi:uncharacterized protein YjbI with pentapeptide repeats